MGKKVVARQAAESEPYQPTPAESSLVRSYLERRAATAGAPRVKVKAHNGTSIHIEPDHRDSALWETKLRSAFGTVEAAFANRLLTQVLNLCPNPRQCDEEVLNAMLAAMSGIGPRDEAEGMLAAQMVATHWVAMDMLRQAAHTSHVPQLQNTSNFAVKLLKTYAAQLEALKRYRSKGEQRMVVQHQHVNVSADRAAVQVNAGTPEGVGASSELEEQAHAPCRPAALPQAQEQPMRRPHPQGDALPGARRDRTAPL